MPYKSNYGARKEKVLWRSGNGNLDTPLLLDAMRDGDQLTLIVPDENPEHGRWLLKLKRDGLSAEGPHGLHHELKKTSFK